jgi:hypothetical protein
MLLSGTLFALFMTGFWLYCLTDAILTPAAECRALPKPAWIVLITVTFIGGAAAWLIVRQPVRGPSTKPLAPVSLWEPEDTDDDSPLTSKLWTAADDALARHPAGRGMAVRATPKGPDDDPDFLRALDRAIRGEQGPSPDVAR